MKLGQLIDLVMLNIVSKHDMKYWFLNPSPFYVTNLPQLIKHQL